MQVRTAIAPDAAARRPYAVTRLFGNGGTGGTGAVTIEVLAPGAISPPSHAAAETVSFLLGGRLACNGSPEPLVAGDAVFHPAGSERSFRNTGSEPALLFAAHAAPGAVASNGDGIEPRRVSPEVGDDPSLDPDSGFISMGVRWLATSDTVGTRKVTLGTSTFEPGGQHDLHRHPHAAEFLLVVAGGGLHLTEDGPVALRYGDLVLIPTGEWHGFCTEPGVTTRTVFGYLGAASLAEAGYELGPSGSRHAL
ncbi:MAG: cupin domain-containing protein [Solirubrobacteraceae bacterium]